MARNPLLKESHPDFAILGVKPWGAVEIDYNNPLSRGLKLCCLLDNPTYINLVTGEEGVAGAGNKLSFTQEGRVGTFAGSTARVAFTDPELIDLPDTRDFAIFIRTFGTGYNDNECAVGWGGTDDLLIYPYEVNLNDGVRVFWSNVGGFGDTANPSDQPAINVWSNILFQSESTSVHRVYVDDVLAISSTATRATSGPFNSFTLGGQIDFNQNFIGDMSFAYAWDRALTVEERFSIHNNPYQILKPATPLTYFVPASVGNVPVFMDLYRQMM